MTTQINRMPTPPAGPRFAHLNKAAGATPTPPVAGSEPPAPTPPPQTVTVTVGSGTPANNFHEFLVVLDDQAVHKVEKAFSMPMGPKRREFVAKTLIDNMMKTQQPIWDVLDGLKASGHVDPEKGYQPLWIQNAIVVHGDDTAETTMASAAGVAQAFKSANLIYNGPVDPTGGETLGNSATKSRGKNSGRDWDIDRVGAPKAWADNITGKNVTVGIIDTGVDVEHPALLTNFRGYNPDMGYVDLTGSWLDTTGKSPDKMVDDGGHGTWVAAKAVGSDGRTNKVGVAPDAKWFAARGLGEEGGTDGMLLRAFQYMVAPRVPTPGTSPGSRRDLTMGADIINNSWGSNNGMSLAYMHALRNIAAMGVINVFAAGNDGKGGVPGSLGSPASSPYVISVGATNRKDKPAEFSSRGPNPIPSPDGEPSPFVAAPGEDVRSAIPGGGYERGWQGTSMAAPMIAGFAALAQQTAMEETGRMFDLASMKALMKSVAEDVAVKGIDDATGYGIPVANELRTAVRAVAKERGLELLKPDPADAGAAPSAG